MKSSRSAFTLIELLIVIAILGILMALLFPAVGGAIDAARKAQAKNDVSQIATAITAYETEYGRLPLPDNTSVDSGLLAVLTGAANNTNNPRQIVFLEVQAAKKGKSGTNASGNFVDPWGNTYQIAMDKDYDNRVDAGYPTKTTIMKKVGVWNQPTNSDASDSQKKRRQVNSWD